MNRILRTVAAGICILLVSVDIHAASEGARLVAAIRGRLPEHRIRTMLRPGVDYRYRDKEGMTPVLAALCWRYYGIAEELIFRYGQPYTGRVYSYNNMNGLLFIVENAYRGLSPAARRIVTRMLQKGGIDLNHKTRTGFTALMHAASGGDLELVKALVNAGADRSLTDPQGRTAALIARQAGNQLVAAWIEGKPVETVLNSLPYMVKMKQTGRVRNYLNEGRDVNAVEPGSNRSGLHYAVETGQDEIARMLVQAGIDLNIRDHHGFTALNRACLLGREQTAMLLIDRGANLHIRAGNKPTLCWMTGIGCFEGAVYAKSMVLLRKLAAAGMNMNPPGTPFGEPLVYLLLAKPKMEDLKLVRWLLANGHRPGSRTLKILETRAKNGCQVGKAIRDLVLSFRK